MGASKTFHHADYELICSAQALDNGKYAPALVVCKQHWPKRPRTISVRSEACLTEEAAMDVAHAQGVDWIQNYG
ncbi:hypothetical protein BURC_00449 [Burkholderiaceae bacterium]|nr:hypothetical protein BURC_00449 [Burkholderiaceae bacterium]